jgi:hypothetical protein
MFHTISDSEAEINVQVLTHLVGVPQNAIDSICQGAGKCCFARTWQPDNLNNHLTTEKPLALPNAVND